MCYCASLLLAFKGDVEAAHAGFAEATTIGDRFGDPQLIALGRVGEGRCLIYLGEIVAGMALLDEAMVAITAHEVSPAAVGDLYCTVIEGCQEVFDVRRAQEWTAALSRWCDSQPELVLYRGQYLVHRAELMLFGGAWADAVAECSAHATGSPDRRASRPSAPLTTCGPSCTVCGVSSLRQRWRTGRRTNGDASHNLVWRSCGLLRVGSMRPTPRCAGSSTRLRTS